jgi:hypothetical protein
MATSTDNQLPIEDRLAIEQQCTRLSYAFAYHIDHGEFEEMIALFTEDGVFDRAGLVHRGHDELREGMRERPPITTRHVMTNFYFDTVGPDVATGTVYVMTYHAHGSYSGEAMVYGTEHGRLMELRDEYRLTVDGWRIASRIGTPIFVPKVWP